MVRMTATDVSRNFSSVLNRVHEGEEIEIVRNGRRMICWIAATALTHGLELVTTNVRHFERVPGLSLLAM
jgi:predicted nucleic acid-binding protein